MQLASAAYGAGAVLSPLLVAANIDYNGGFHASFWAIGLATATAAAAPLLVPSPHPPAVAAKPAGAAPGPPAVGGGAALLVFYSFFFWYDMLHYGL